MIHYTGIWNYNNCLDSNRQNAYGEYFNLSNLQNNFQTGSSIMYGNYLISYVDYTFYIYVGSNGSYSNTNGFSTRNFYLNPLQVLLYDSSGNMISESTDNNIGNSPLEVIQNNPRKIIIPYQGKGAPTNGSISAISIGNYDSNDLVNIVYQDNNVINFKYSDKSVYLNGKNGSLIIASNANRTDIGQGAVCSSIAMFKIMKDGSDCNFTIKNAYIQSKSKIKIVFNQNIAFNRFMLTY